ncbi:MAG: 16S rRNA (guanine(527)-N(7))-methyltransferase RsmG [Bacilli bacterium]|nr:16S rRNA (guanine(527)-N(7))-methyltransferase RsmG [Bacilli bacterium]MDD4795125.1 16S rRNA (guanine(527)-N(7))-methyltransferase RsmG [Bacilli bacterium]
MNKEEFIKEIEKLNINYNEEKLDKLDIYYKYLMEYNSHTNLTSITEEKEVYLKHFYDSLTITKVVNLNMITSLLDIGTGAGFPGIVLKIFYPHLEIVLLDSNNKKTKFLTQLIELIELSDVKVVNERSEEYIIGRRESFDLVTSRAVANLQTLSELSLPFVKLGGLFIPLKGATTSELKASEYAIIKLGGKIDKIITFLLPIENSKRTLIKVKKIMITKTEYPRSFDKILKKPLENN